MTDTEFQVLDELYFVSSFKELVTACNLNDQQLEDTLFEILEQGWVKALQADRETEVDPASYRKPGALRAYFFLATKAGLLAHNSR